MPEQNDKSPEQRLIGATCSGQINVVRELLKQKGLDINFQDDEKSLPLWVHEVLGVEHWFDMNPPLARTGKSGNTALMWACWLNRTRVAAALLEAGADAKVTNLLGENALHLIGVGDDARYLVDRMVAAGADVNARSVWGVTPLMVALANGSPELAVKLLEIGADPLLKAVNGNDAFAVAEQMEMDPAFINRMRRVAEDRKRAVAAELEKQVKQAAEASRNNLRAVRPRVSPLRKAPKPK